jgi:pimeloyl-ACP methyl ester carboxylesterase
MTFMPFFRRRFSLWRILAAFVLSVVVFLNVVVYLQAGKFTQFVDEAPYTPQQIEQLGGSARLKLALTGVDVAKSKNMRTPGVPFDTVSVESGAYTLRGWVMGSDTAKATVVIWHGHLSCKANMLDRAEALSGLGYRVAVFDFRGHGDSDGYNCTIGYTEADDIDAVDAWAQRAYPGQIFHMGSSMGGAALLRAAGTQLIKPAGIVVECPFGSMLEATQGRIRAMGLPTPVLAELLVFWGSVRGGFNAFAHKPSRYAAGVSVPTLLLWGAKDPRVTRSETEAIYKNLVGAKKMVVFEKSAHESYLNHHAAEWQTEMAAFLQNPQAVLETR